ncbi:unnamed protein product [Arctia plantaginis]|uniref:Uncharacterized protein n=1 Tax=Arctia plantaginis TaxID=874455 RepID=A0A8S0YMX1_ARCPL|nr:unnamed protein product [Arctia plantaginis]
MCLKNVLTVTLLLGIATANVVVNDDGWLDSLLEKNKDKLEKYVKKDNSVDIQAVILPKPDGFKDPKNWSLGSVLALIKLIKESKSSEPVLQIMRRAFNNSGAKFRGYDLDPPNTIVRIKNHMQAQLPHSEIRLISVM